MKKTRHTYLTVRCEVTILPACDCSTMPGPIRGHRKNRRGRGGGPKIMTGWGVKIWLQGGGQLQGTERGRG